jgi:hypothetical protein
LVAGADPTGPASLSPASPTSRQLRGHLPVFGVNPLHNLVHNLVQIPVVALWLGCSQLRL